MEGTTVGWNPAQEGRIVILPRWCDARAGVAGRCLQGNIVATVNQHWAGRLEAYLRTLATQAQQRALPQKRGSEAGQ